MSGGRAQATVGVGWSKDEYDAIGAPFSKRGRMADEYLAAMFELWHSDSPSFDGEFVSFHDVAFRPKPIHQPHPVIWIGGDADAALRRAARFGDGWAPWLTKPEELPAKMDYLRSQPGFDDRPFALFYSLAALSIGEEHAITHDPNAQFGQSAQQMIDTSPQNWSSPCAHTPRPHPTGRRLVHKSAPTTTRNRWSQPHSIAEPQ